MTRLKCHSAQTRSESTSVPAVVLVSDQRSIGVDTRAHASASLRCQIHILLPCRFLACIDKRQGITILEVETGALLQFLWTHKRLHCTCIDLVSLRHMSAAHQCRPGGAQNTDRWFCAADA